MIPKDVAQIVDVVGRIEESKREQKRVPAYAIITEVIAQSQYTAVRTRELLRQAVRLNLLQFGETLNNYYFKTV